MIPYPKKRAYQAVMLFFALLFLVFLFRFFEVKQNLFDVPAFSHLKSGVQDSKKELPKNKDEQILSGCAEFETSGGSENETAPNSYSENNSANGLKNNEENVNSEKELPKTLNIPKLGINAKVQYVGLNFENEMDAPSNNNDVAWFSLGVVPGKKGSAVIAGHLNGKSGEPAIFWDLHKLEIGNDIYVVDNGGDERRFQVMSVEKYKTNSAPMEKIFGLNDGVYLNLITCGGRWDRAENTYDERLVVFAKYSKDTTTKTQ